VFERETSRTPFFWHSCVAASIVVPFSFSFP
jgi:hypothetical protein